MVILEKQHIIHPKRVCVIGVPISAVTMESALEFIHANQESLCGEYICASNVHTTVMAHEHQDYHIVQSSSLLSLPDGKPLSVIGRRKANAPMEKVTGTHFMQQIMSDPRFSGKRHFFYGTHKQTLETMVTQLRKDYPQLCICGYEPSVFRELTDAETEALANRINDSRPDFIWVALGAPRQELLMYRLKGRVCGIMCGVGGAFNILAGIVSDAPVWMQNAGLEWLYRLLKEPRRLFRRYLITKTKFIYYLLSGKLKGWLNVLEKSLHDHSQF